MGIRMKGKYGQIRCVMCSIVVEKEFKNQILCSDIRCKQFYKRKVDNARSKNRTVENRITKSEMILKEAGYVVIPPTKGYRVIMEPMSQ